MKIIYFLLVALVSIPIISMQLYRRKRDAILTREYGPLAQMGISAEESKEALINQCYAVLHNKTARMKKEEKENDSACCELWTMAVSLCALTYNAYSNRALSTELVCFLCGATMTMCGTIMYEASCQHCKMCARKNYEHKLKTVDDLLFERDLLLYQD